MEHQPLDVENPLDAAKTPGGTVVGKEGGPGPEASTADQSGPQTKADSAPRPWYGIRWLVPAVLLLAGLIGGGVWLWPRILLALNTVTTDDDAAQEPHPTSVPIPLCGGHETRLAMPVIQTSQGSK